MQELKICANEIGMAVLVEVHNKNELDFALKLKTKLIGINNRNLQTFKTTLQTTLDLLPYIPPEKLIVTESGITIVEDVKYMLNINVRAFLIGEILMKALEPGVRLARLFL